MSMNLALLLNDNDKLNNYRFKTILGKGLIFIIPLLANTRYFAIPNAISLILALIILGVTVVSFFRLNRLLSSNKAQLISVLLIIIFTAVSLIRREGTPLSNRLTFALIFFSYTFSIVTIINYFRGALDILLYFFLGVVFYLGIVFVFNFIFVPAGGMSFFAIVETILSMGLTFIQRSIIETELTGSINQFAFLTGISSLFFYLKFSETRKFIYLGIFTFCFFFLVITAARMPIFILLVSIIIYTYFNSNHKVPFLTAGMFLLLIVVILGFSKLQETYLSIFRGEELYTLNGRIFFWQSIFQDFSSFKLIHLVGEGSYGNQNLPGMKRIMSVWGVRNEDFKFMTTHNLYVQILVDMGYIVFFTFLFLFRRVYLRIGKLSMSVPKTTAFRVLLIFTLLCGITEAIWGNYYLINSLAITAIISSIIFKPRYKFQS